MEETLVKRVMPHSIEAEQSVVGSMLYAPEAIEAAAEILTGADFYQQQYGIIFDALLDLHNAGKPADIVNLQNLLRTKDVAPEVYSLDFLRDLLNSVFTSANIRSYAQIVSDKAQLRRMIRALSDLENDCYLEKEPVEKLMQETEKKVFDLLETRKRGDGQRPIDEIMLNVIRRIETVSKSGGNVIGIPTGFIDLDNMTTGMQPSDLVILAGRPAVGKTAFVLNLASNFAVRNNYVTAIFEEEMSAEQLTTRLLSMESHVDAQKLRTGQLSDQEWDDIAMASAPIARSNLIIDDTPGITVSEIRSRCRKYKLEKNLQVVIIDYLQILGGTGNSRASESRQLEISEMTRALKIMARELNVPVILLSQLSRASESRQDHRPMLSDLRESGAIEQDADIVMFLYRDELFNKDTADKGITEVIVAKQRSGPIGTVKLKWLSNLTKFANIEYRDSNYE